MKLKRNRSRALSSRSKSIDTIRLLTVSVFHSYFNGRVPLVLNTIGKQHFSSHHSDLCKIN